jgi:hypothetical protein
VAVIVVVAIVHIKIAQTHVLRRLMVCGVIHYHSYNPFLSALAAPSASHAVQQQTAMTSHDMTDIPVRMVVDFRYVGAIIGQGGANIRDITKDCKARCWYVCPYLFALM